MAAVDLIAPLGVGFNPKGSYRMHYWRLVPILAFLLPLCGQVNKSNLTGVIHDPTGSAIPRVALRLINTATGAVREEVSDTSGRYRFTLLGCVVQRLQPHAPGFRILRSER